MKYLPVFLLMLVVFGVRCQDFDLHSRLKSIELQFALGSFTAESIIDFNTQVVVNTPLHPTSSNAAFHFGAGIDLWTDIFDGGTGLILCSCI